MIETIEIDLELSPYIPGPPMSKEQLYGQSCSNDAVTISTWRQVWIDQIKANHAKYGPWADKSAGQFWEKHRAKPAILVGSGPSLKKNVGVLAELSKDDSFLVVSCLHNFHYMVDNGVEVDFYVTLDSGEVTISEMWEGGSRTSDEYIELTKHHKLLAFIGTHPKLLETWRGETYYYNAPIPDKGVDEEISRLEPFNLFFSNGGNVLGASLYFARGIMAANPVIFTGADFSFSYTNKFHAWNSKYDGQIGQHIKCTDIYGNRVKTWQSYFNFKCWFDHVSCAVPGMYINATEGGIFGAYDPGNIIQIRQMKLAEVKTMYEMYKPIKDSVLNPATGERVVLF